MRVSFLNATTTKGECFGVQKKQRQGMDAEQEGQGEGDHPVPVAKDPLSFLIPEGRFCQTFSGEIDP